jgi:hypothetical protein
MRATPSLACRPIAGKMVTMLKVLITTMATALPAASQGLYTPVVHHVEDFESGINANWSITLGSTSNSFALNQAHVDGHHQSQALFLTHGANTTSSNSMPTARLYYPTVAPSVGVAYMEVDLMTVDCYGASAGGTIDMRFSSNMLSDYRIVRLPDIVGAGVGVQCRGRLVMELRQDTGLQMQWVDIRWNRGTATNRVAIDNFRILTQPFGEVGAPGIPAAFNPRLATGPHTINITGGSVYIVRRNIDLATDTYIELLGHPANAPTTDRSIAGEIWIDVTTPILWSISVQWGPTIASFCPVNIPDDPILIGLPLAWQGLHIDQNGAMRLTPPVMTRIVDKRLM